MPHFKLDAINYIITCNRQKILNFDFTNNNNQSKKEISFFTDNETGTYNLSSASFEYLNNRNLNEHGFVFHEDPSITIRALYDAKDVALKSNVAKQIVNRSYDDETKGSSDSVNIEMYAPHLKKDPLGFAQLADYAYGLTDKTVVNAVIRRTNLVEKKEALSVDEYDDSFSNPVWSYYLNPYDEFGSDEHNPGRIPNLIPTFLYTPLSNLHNILFNTLRDEHSTMLLNESISAETLSSISAMAESYTSSYYAFMTFFKERSTDILSNLFKPVHNFENIDYNFILEVPLRKGITEDNDYRNGLVNADMIMAKNVYNDIYSTDVSAVGDYKRVREYKGINAVGGKLFLTYFDDMEYIPTEDDALNLSTEMTYKDYDENGPKNITERNVTPQKTRDYMKIECIDAINRFVSTTIHKPSLFSAKVYGLNELLKDEKYDIPGNKDQFRDNIKRDISNSIRRIVTNFVPAHTQFFDVVDFDKDAYKDQEC